MQHEQQPIETHLEFAERYAKSTKRTILYAIAYARVSHPDQAKKNLSVPAQYRRIDEWAQQNNVVILYRDADEGVSAHDEKANREAFNRLVDIACHDNRITLFLIDDIERFYRDKYMSGTIKGRLRKHGVKVIITSDPYDPTTIEGVWRESIGEAQAQTSSMKTSFYTFRGQEENIQTRDPETGWCYKNGGRAPFGYRSVRVARGQNIRHLDIIKVIWELDPEPAEVMQYYYRELKLKQRLSHQATHRELNRLNMLSPTPGRPWTISSVITMMQEDRILQYAGMAIWNKEDHKTQGKRFKDKSEWIKVENAHPAIITMEEAEELLKLKEERGRDAKWGRTEDSDWLLVGKNILGEDFFVCLECGTKMSSYQPTMKNRKCYLCGNARYRGENACIHKTIDKEWIEEFLLKQIKKHFGTKAKAKEIADNFNKSLKEDNSDAYHAREKLTKAIETADQKLSNLAKAVANGFDITIANEEMKNIKSEKARANSELIKIDGELKLRPQLIEAENLLAMYRNLEKAFAGHENRTKKELLRRFVRRIEFDPQEDRVSVHLFTEPTSTSAVWFSYGAQDRT